MVSNGILVVSEVFPPAIGGSGALLENVYRRMSACGVRVLADLAPVAPPPYVGPLDVSRISMRAPDWGVLKPASLFRHVRVARAIRGMLNDAPAVVHCARALPEGLSAAMALAGRGSHYVTWLHGEELGYASTSRELTWLARRVYHGAAAVVANSRNSKDLLVRQWAVPEERVHVVYPGVDASRFNPRVDGGAIRSKIAGPGDVVLLSIGRLQRRKGHDVVLQALVHVRLAVPRVRYVVAGDGPHRAVLEAQARELGLTDIVTFAGAVPENELPQWYRAADVFVLPNRPDGVDFEGFGIVFLEAAASGLPVIAGRSGGAPEAILEGATGLLVDGEDVADVTGAIVELASSPERRTTLGRAGAERAAADFSWEAAASRLAAVLQRPARTHRC